MYDDYERYDEYDYAEPDYDSECPYDLEAFRQDELRALGEAQQPLAEETIDFGELIFTLNLLDQSDDRTKGEMWPRTFMDLPTYLRGGGHC